MNKKMKNLHQKRKPRKLSEADFDEDGLISIEDFEEIEAQKWERNLKQV